MFGSSAPRSIGLVGSVHAQRMGRVPAALQD